MRLPRFTPGDIIAIGNRKIVVKHMGKKLPGTTLMDSSRFIVTEEETIQAKQVGHIRDAVDAVVVSEEENELMILDPFTFRTVNVKKPIGFSPVEDGEIPGNAKTVISRDSRQVLSYRGGGFIPFFQFVFIANNVALFDVAGMLCHKSEELGQNDAVNTAGLIRTFVGHKGGHAFNPGITLKINRNSRYSSGNNGVVIQGFLFSFSRIVFTCGTVRFVGSKQLEFLAKELPEGMPEQV